jgi:carbonic anhydrase
MAPVALKGMYCAHCSTFGCFSILHTAPAKKSCRLEETIREDLDFLRSQGLVRDELKKSAKGYIYDIKTGKLALVSDLNEEKL